MSHEITTITANSEYEVWIQLKADLQKQEGLMEYSVAINQNGRKLMLIIDIDPGGGFEGGYAFTTLSAPLQQQIDFKFAIHKEGFFDEVGKFFGMQDIVIGYPEFDDKVIVKTNNENKTRKVFESAETRDVFKTLKDYRFEITHHHNPQTNKEEQYLELVIEAGINEPALLQPIYHAFVDVLEIIDNP
jgi:hypothetical protein